MVPGAVRYHLHSMEMKKETRYVCYFVLALLASMALSFVLLHFFGKGTSLYLGPLNS